MRVHLPQGLMVQLGPKDFVGQGGEGRVFAQPPEVYKIYHEPHRVMPLAKMKELSVIAHDQVLTPTDPLRNDGGQLVGYTMPYVGQSVPLCRLFNRNYRERHGICFSQIVQLTHQIATILREIHRSGILVVDLNPLNILVSDDHSTVYFIDTDSYATPSFPATALMDSIRDPLILDEQFTEGSDWYAFAVITFQLFVGVHPFRGKHPQMKRFSQRVASGISVFNPEVSLPPMASPIGEIPVALRQWYQDVFDAGVRTPPPEDFGLRETILLDAFVQGGELSFDVDHRFEEPIRTCGEAHGRSVVVTDEWIYVDGHRRGATPPGQIEIVFSPRRWVPLVLAWTAADGLRVWDTETLSTRAFGLHADALLRAGRNAFILSSGRLLALELIDTPDGVQVGTRLVTQVHRMATDVYPGCLVQNVMGTRYITCVSEAGAVNRRIPELDEYRILDAAHMDGVLVVVGLKNDTYHHFLIRWAPHGNHYRLVHRADVDPIPAMVIVTDSGVAVYQEDGHDLCLVHVDPQSSRRRRVALGELSSFDLWPKPYGIGFVRGQEMGTVRLTPTG